MGVGGLLADGGHSDACSDAVQPSGSGSRCSRCSMMAHARRVMRMLTSAVAVGEVSSLDHEALDDPVEDAALEVQRLASALPSASLAGAQLAEVVRRLQMRQGDAAVSDPHAACNADVGKSTMWWLIRVTLGVRVVKVPGEATRGEEHTAPTLGTTSLYSSSTTRPAYKAGKLSEATGCLCMALWTNRAQYLCKNCRPNNEQLQ